MKTRIELSGYVNRILFEGYDFPDDGNGCDHTKNAAYAWKNAASRSLSDAGYTEDVTIGHGSDHYMHGPFITINRENDEGEEYVDDPTPAESEKIAADWEAAMDAGFAAAEEYAAEARKMYAALV